jgi:hypothetical protein
MMRTSFILFFICIFLFSCKKKEENYIISGYVTNPELNIAVSQMQVSLWGTKISSGTVQNQQVKLGSYTTDASGHFEFEFEKAVYSTIKIVLFKNDYFETEQNINPNNLNPGQSYNINISAHGLAWLKTIVKNIGSQYNEDVLTYKLSLPYQNCSSCCSTEQIIFNGTGIDTSWICPVYAGSKISVQWIYSYNQNIQPHFDTLVINLNDTITHQLLY